MHTSEIDSTTLYDRIETRSSHLVEPARNPLFDTHVSPIMRLAGSSSLSNLANTIGGDSRSDLYRAIAEAMTVTETSFFRDPHLFEALRTAVLPALIRLRTPTRRLRLWSAACSTGQEAFSLAILLDRLLPQSAGWDIEIHGTDISAPAIDYAQRGLFRSSEVHRGLTPQLLAQYFTPHDDMWAIPPRLAALCHFRIANLCAPPAPSPQFDLILLRNVLLYLSPADRANVLTTMHGQLAPEGCLILGDAEYVEDSPPLFLQQVVKGTYLYRPVSAT